jgi:WD40 repeat protein
MIYCAIAALTLMQGEQAPKAPAPQTAKPAAAATAPGLPAVKGAPVIALAKDLPGLHPLAFAPAPSGGIVAMTLEDNSVRLFNAATRITSKTLIGHPQPAYAIAWSADGAWLATGDETARMFLWDARTGEKLKEMRNHQRGIQNLSFNLPRTMLVSTGKDDVVKIWDPLTGKQLKSIEGKGANLYSATFSPKTDSIAVGTIGSGARVYIKDGSVKNFFTNPDVTEVNDVAFNSAGNMLVTAGRIGNTRLWDLKALKGMGSFKGHTDWVIHARFSPNGKYLATSSTDRTVRVYDVATYQPIAVIENESAVGAPITWTADGKWLLTAGSDDSLQIYSVTPAQAGAAETKTPAKTTAKKKKKSRKARH